MSWFSFWKTGDDLDSKLVMDDIDTVTSYHFNRIALGDFSYSKKMFLVVPSEFSLPSSRNTVSDYCVNHECLFEKMPYFAVIRDGDELSGIVSPEMKEMIQFDPFRRSKRCNYIRMKLGEHVTSFYGNNLLGTQYDKDYDDLVLPSALSYDEIKLILNRHFKK